MATGRGIERAPSAAETQLARRRLLTRGFGVAAGGALLGTAGVAALGAPAGASALAPMTTGTGVDGIYDVMDFGATGNGTTDDTAALQAAITASVASPGGGICLVPHGTFVMTSALLVPAGAHVVIDGTILLGDGANQDMIFITGSNVLIEGTGTLDGNGSKQTITIGGIVNTAGISNAIIRGLTVQNVHNWGINLTGCTNMLLQDLVLANNGNSNEFAAEAKNCWARNCTITGTNDWGFAFYGGVTDSGITDSLSYANAGPGIGVLSDAGQPVLCQNITIANNHSFDNISSQPGIAAITGPGVSGRHQNLLITGNETHGNAGAGMLIGDVTGCLISGNVCHDDDQQELIIEGVNEAQVVGNYLANPGTSAAPNVALELSNPSTGSDPGSALADVAIVHNILTATNGTMTYALAGGPADRAFIHGNVMSGWSTAAANFTPGENDTISDNTPPIQGQRSS